MANEERNEGILLDESFGKVSISGINGRVKVVEDNTADKVTIRITGNKRAVRGIDIGVVDGVLVISDEPDESGDNITIGNVNGQVAIGSNISQSSSVVISNVVQSIDVSGNSHVGNISQSCGCGIHCGGTEKLYLKVTMPGHLPLKVEGVRGSVTIGKFYEIDATFRTTADIEEAVRLKVTANSGAGVVVGNVKLSLDAESNSGSNITVEDGDITDAKLTASGGAKLVYNGAMQGTMKLTARNGAKVVAKKVGGEPEIIEKSGGRVHIIARLIAEG